MPHNGFTGSVADAKYADQLLATFLLPIHDGGLNELHGSMADLRPPALRTENCFFFDSRVVAGSLLSDRSRKSRVDAPEQRC